MRNVDMAVPVLIALIGMVITAIAIGVLFRPAAGVLVGGIELTGYGLAVQASR